MSTAAILPIRLPLEASISEEPVQNANLVQMIEPELASPPSPLFKLKTLLSAPKTSAADLNQVLIEIYGNDLVQRVHHSGMTKSWPVNLERRHILHILAAIGHVVTLKDLNGFWTLLRQMPANFPVLQLLQVDPLTLQTFTRVQDLPNAQFHQFVQAFRNPLKVLEPANPKTLWEEIASLPKVYDKRCMAYTRYDQTVHQLYASADRTRQEFPFAPHEHLAKFVGYAKPSSVQPGMIIPVYVNDKVTYYQMESHIHKSGLHAYLFTPINGNSDLPAQLVFRGTNGTGSLSRDLDTAGIGKTVFDQNAPAILQMIEHYAQKTGNLKLEVAGHSLGAADAQRAIALLADQVANNPDSPLKPALKELKLFAYCSPKLDRGSVEKWKQNLNLLAGVENPPRIELNFAEHEKDPITKAGELNLCSANASFIEANYLIVKSISGLFNGLTHHNTPFFHAGVFDFQTDNRTFLLFQDRAHKRILYQLAELADKRLVPAPEEDLARWFLVLTEQEALTDEERIEELDAENRLVTLQQEKAVVNDTQKGASEHSWLVWTASSILGQPLKLLLGFVTGLL